MTDVPYYKDVMRATGLLPAEEAEADPVGAAPGLECAGVVTAVGPDVTGPAPGDRVCALTTGALASHVTTTADLVAPIPPAMTFAEAATLPVAFSTVLYGLGRLARLRAGETVLIHGGAGGVGLAALQYARGKGARVIATAGTATKRDLLRTLGADHVLNSRDLLFAGETERFTGGAGVDVVLNSLAGEAMTRGLESLRAGGRFVELGIRDMWEGNALPLRPFHRGLSFFGANLTHLLADPLQRADLYAEVTAGIADGTLRPLPHSRFPAARVAEAFDLMRRARHIGKIVICFDPLDEPVLVESPAPPPRFDDAGTYLVTGGLGGFGGATARRLAGLGARHLALVSRRGSASPEAPALLDDLRSQGAQVTAYAADVTDTAAMDDLFDRIAASGRPLRGVVHAAMYVPDSMDDSCAEHIAAVLAPKLAGGLILDELTRTRNVPLFWAYSSLAALIGSRQQASYTAANLYLEALVRHRRHRGDSGLAVGWGHIEDVGFVSRTDFGHLLNVHGMVSSTSDELLSAAQSLLTDGPEAAVVSRYHWGRARNFIGAANAATRFSLIIPASLDDDSANGDNATDLAQLPAAEAVASIAAGIARELARVLHTDPQRLDPTRRLEDFGLDSLMAAELIAVLRNTYTVEIPAMEFVRSGGTIADIADLIHLRLSG